MKRLKDEKGITLIALVVTIVILLILAVSVNVGLNSSNKINQFNLVKSDVLLLEQEIKVYYAKNGILPIDNKSSYNLKEAIPENDINPNDSDNYYAINNELLNVKLNNDISKYVVNDKTLTVYYKSGIEFNGEIYYTMQDTFQNGNHTVDYYSKVNLPIISVVTIESSNSDKTIATEGDTLTVNILSNYNFTNEPVLKILNVPVTITWNNLRGTASYTIKGNETGLVDGSKISFEISGYSADGRTGETITDSTFGKDVYYYTTPILAATDVSNSASEIFGQKVNYKVKTAEAGEIQADQDTSWEVLYADDSNIYLISTNYVKNTVLPYGRKTTGATTDLPDKVDGSKYMAYIETITRDYSEGLKRITNDKIKKLNSLYFTKFPNGTHSEYGRTVKYDSSTGITTETTSTKLYSEIYSNIAYMLDTDAWSTYKDSENKAEFAIGGATTELIINSYNKTHTNENYVAKLDEKEYTGSFIQGAIEYRGKSIGYSNYNKIEKVAPYIAENEKEATGYWLASPGVNNQKESVSIVDIANGKFTNRITGRWIGSSGAIRKEIPQYAFRPVIRLKSECALKWNKNNDAYDIVIK